MGKIPKNTDQLTTAFKNNDENVMQKVYQNIFPKFRTYVLNNSGAEVQAKDVFQEAFISCWRNIKEDKLAPNSNVEGYLFTIAKNKWIDHLRSSNTMKTMAIDSFSQLSLVSEEGEKKDEKEAQLIAIRNALKGLKHNCRSLLNLFYFERKSMEEISKKINLSPASARNQKYRCMEKLRALSYELKKNG
ncbi:MAG: sigma-70 family RNA polymerase sigma factor [Bacteroidota bacterium]